MRLRSPTNRGSVIVPTYEWRQRPCTENECDNAFLDNQEPKVLDEKSVINKQYKQFNLLWIMALCNELPVYIDTYNYIKEVVAIQKIFPRDVKHTVGQTWITKCVELPTFIIHANMFKSERERWLSEFICQFEYCKMIVRMACDMHWISLSQAAKLMYLEAAIGKQVTAWKNASKKRLRRRHSTADDDVE